MAKRQNEPTYLCTRSFLAAAGISAPTAQMLRNNGILKPNSLDNGYTLWRPEDVEAAQQWKASRRERRAE